MEVPHPMRIEYWQSVGPMMMGTSMHAGADGATVARGSLFCNTTFHERWQETTCLREHRLIDPPTGDKDRRCLGRTKFCPRLSLSFPISHQEAHKKVWLDRAPRVSGP